MLKEFYPTPRHLLEKVFEGIKWYAFKSVLEPSAGKGDIADFMLEHDVEQDEIDCIELEPVLKATLEGKGYHVIYNDFLSYQTYKQYDLIVMNPPFSNGDEHLMKALELQKDGGSIICILNAATLDNPYTRRRQELLHLLEQYHADISYMDDMFQEAERSTSVRIAVVKVTIPKKQRDSALLSGLRESKKMKTKDMEATAVSSADYIKAIVENYNLEAEAGIWMINEYQALKPYIMGSIKANHYSKPLISLEPTDVNKYLKKLRLKYWEALFENERFTAGMTNNLRNEYRRIVSELAAYDFTYYNIKELQIKMAKQRCQKIEETILGIFDVFTKHFWFPECQSNIHYYNGATRLLLKR